MILNRFLRSDLIYCHLYALAVVCCFIYPRTTHQFSAVSVIVNSDEEKKREFSILVHHFTEKESLTPGTLMQLSILQRWASKPIEPHVLCMGNPAQHLGLGRGEPG